LSLFPCRFDVLLDDGLTFGMYLRVV